MVVSQMQNEPQGFMFKGEFSPSLDVYPLREEIAALLAKVRGDKPEEENIFVKREVLTKSNQRSN